MDAPHPNHRHALSCVVPFFIIFLILEGSAIYLLINDGNNLNKVDEYNDAIQNTSCRLNNCRSETNICGVNICYNYIFELVTVSQPPIVGSAIVTTNCNNSNICGENGTVLISDLTDCYYSSLSPKSTLSLIPIQQEKGDSLRYGVSIVFLIFDSISLLILLGVILMMTHGILKDQNRGVRLPD